MHIATITFFCLLFISTNCSPASQDTTASRIVNGYEVDIAEIPYQATLRRRVTSGWTHLCGAVIINSKALLSAAHCVTVYQADPTSLNVAVGTSYRLSNGKSYELKRIIVHENYSASTLQNDISLIITRNKMSFSQKVNSIAIAKKNYHLPNGTEALVSGFGSISYEGPASSVLLAAKVNILDQVTCSRAYTGIASITDGMICASGRNPPRDACQGDSGGPLVANNILVGIVSWGERCADQIYPGVYTKVSEYESWTITRVNLYT